MWLLQGLLGACCGMAGLWLIQRKTGNAALVDLGWTLSLPGLHWWLLLSCGVSGRGLVLATLVSLWGLRLGSYLYWTRLRPGMVEEGRYRQLRQEWGPQFQGKLFWFYQAQAWAAWLLALVFVPVYADLGRAWGGAESLGVVLFCWGWAGVILADSQLHRFKSDPKNQGQICQQGLWNYSRHPNYFFECVLWFGWALLGSASSGLPWLAPLTILHLVLNVTGIPPSEAQALRSKGQAYLDYQRSTSAFVPWWKRS